PNKNPGTNPAEFESEQSNPAKRHQKLASKNHVPTRGARTRPKNNNKNKTTKHTIEFSNNTRFRATLLLYSIAKAPSNCTIHCQGQVCVVPSRLLYPLDFCAETGQVLHEQRVAPIDVKDVVDLGVAVGDQARKYQSGARPDVG